MQEDFIESFHPQRCGKRHSIFDCFYCGIKHKKVECAGLYFCPNPLCLGPGGVWFRNKLSSFEELSSGKHTVDMEELHREAIKYLDIVEDSVIQMTIRFYLNKIKEKYFDDKEEAA